jgi:phosphatidylserine decarboxylase
VLRDSAERVFATAFSFPLTSRLVGRLADLRLPGFLLRPLVRGYARLYGAALEEAAEPVAAYRTFDAFFTRRLRPGARPLDPDPRAVVSPADSRLSVIGPVGPEGRLEQVKGRSYSLAALLGSEADAEPYRRGVQATLYLSPGMYHRVHAPVAGAVVAWRHLPGRLFPVNGPAVRQIDGLFARNERVAVHLDSAAFGPVAVVLVGAANVGRITLSFAPLVTNRGGSGGRTEPATPVVLDRGGELGVFHLGSTVVLLLADPSLRPAAVAGDLVRMGQALFRS